MSNGWALVICLLEDDPVAPVAPRVLTPEEIAEIDRIDDPEDYIQQRYSDYYFHFQTQLNGRLKKKLANNTYLLRRPDGVLAVRFHNTDILTIFPDNRVVTSTHGTGADKYRGANHRWGHYGGEEQQWHTPATLERLNLYLPGTWRLFGKKPRGEDHASWNWFWYNSSGDYRSRNKQIPYTDGDFISGSGELNAQQNK